MQTINLGNSGVFGKFAKWAAVIVIALLLLSVLSPFTIIPAGHRGVVTTFGKVHTDVLGEGLHLVIPIVNKVHKIDVRVQKGEGEGEAASRDLQEVNTKVAINYHLNPSSVSRVFQEIGDLHVVEERIIVPAVHEAVKAATAQFSAEELVTKRQAVRDSIRAKLAERLTRHGVIVDEFSIVNFAFSKNFSEAIEAKTTAEQLKLKAERDLERIKIEADQKVAQAKAEAESLSIQKQQVTAELIRLREAENQRIAIEKWNGQLPNVTSGAVPFIQLQSVGR